MSLVNVLLLRIRVQVVRRRRHIRMVTAARYRMGSIDSSCRWTLYSSPSQLLGSETPLLAPSLSKLSFMQSTMSCVCLTEGSAGWLRLYHNTRQDFYSFLSFLHGIQRLRGSGGGRRRSSSSDYPVLSCPVLSFVPIPITSSVYQVCRVSSITLDSEPQGECQLATYLPTYQPTNQQPTTKTTHPPFFSSLHFLPCHASFQ
jgi:hypothetical protein